MAAEDGALPKPYNWAEEAGPFRGPFWAPGGTGKSHGRGRYMGKSSIIGLVLLGRPTGNQGFYH